MMDCDEGGEFDGTQDEPRYLMLARVGEMYQEGGHNLTADPQRAGWTPRRLDRTHCVNIQSIPLCFKLKSILLKTRPVLS